MNSLKIGWTGPQWAHATSDVHKAEEPGEEMRATQFPLATMFGIVHIHSKEEGPEISGIIPEKHPMLQK